MTRLLLLAFLLVSTVVALAPKEAKKTAEKVNKRQVELYNKGDYAALVKELYDPNAELHNEKDVLARGHKEIIARMNKFAGKIKTAKVGEVSVTKDDFGDVIVATVNIDHTIKSTGEKRKLVHKQHISSKGKIILVTDITPPPPTPKPKG